MPHNRSSYQQQAWNQLPESDAHRPQPRNVIEAREHNAATAFVKGKRWFIEKKLRRHRLSADSREVSRQLVERSRKLVSESRQLIVESKNVLAFARVPNDRVN